jgi:lipopolysaccharide transport system ATP-binding protein
VSQSIIVERLSKQYRLGQVESDLLHERVIEWLKHPFLRNGFRPPETIWALKDVSFQVEHGEVLGIIGSNGAGKSTLLKVLSRITYPTSGTLRVNGRIAALLEVGTGFHGDLTGRENVFLNGSILGMSKREIKAKLDAIVAFAGVERFIDTPVKRYSSGMFLRLGFAIAAHLEPDILVVDEVLAVGDLEFQKKCLTKMDDLRGGGRTVLFVSHNMPAIQNLCSRVIWIDDGQVRKDGNVGEVIGAYTAAFSAASGTGADLRSAQNRRGSGQIRFTRLEFLASDGQHVKSIFSGQPVTLRIQYYAQERILHPYFDVAIYTDLGTLVTRFSTGINYELRSLPSGHGSIDLNVDCFSFLPGRYRISLWLKMQGGALFDGLEHCAQFDVEPSNYYGTGKGMVPAYFGIVFLPCSWRLSHSPIADAEPVSTT